MSLARWLQVMVFGWLSLSACTQDASPPPTADAGGGDLTPNPDAGKVPDAPTRPPLGWSLRADVPYPRVDHVAVLDPVADRMVVYGGGANDVWTLPLSGPERHRWRQMQVPGPQPPVHTYGQESTPSYRDAAVYDPVGRRMIVCLNPVPSVTEAHDRVEVWALALAGEPHWQRIALLEGTDAQELQGARAAYDARAQRVLMFGGGSESSGLWALSLADTPAWSRLAGPPDGSVGRFFNGHSVVLDARHDRLLLLGGLPASQAVWSFDLVDGAWQVLTEDPIATNYGSDAVVDAERDRLVVLSGESGSMAAYAFDTDRWDVPAVALNSLRASVVVDGARDRLLLFGGVDPDSRAPSNATWAVSLSDWSTTRIGPPSVTTDPGASERMNVYDPARDAVISFGGYDRAQTFVRALDGSSPEHLSLPGTPRVSYGGALYDPDSRAVISFGGYAYRESAQTSRLPSDSNAGWQAMDAGPGPVERSGHVMVYDADGQRAVIFGGARNTSYPPSQALDDVWALSLVDAPRWTELLPEGEAPPAGREALGICDPDERRMLVFRNGQTWALSLADPPRWTRIATRGRAPDTHGEGSAVYDSDTHRMLIIWATQTTEGGQTEVFALSLSDHTWHRFCPEGITPGRAGAGGATDGNAVLTPDGLYLSTAGAGYRFDLATPYCE